MQLAVQYNIWKQSIHQRQQDEMVLTTFISLTMLFLAVYQTLIINTIHHLGLQITGKHVEKYSKVLTEISDAKLKNYCESVLPESTYLYELMQLIALINFIYSVAMATSIIQKILTQRLLHNVILDYF